ncbi:hypothetical protein Fmac_018410 [Flemingia macrophylla]|uniref:Uncharacterized protein n=1 Tax=Flemingia macrophylla TaxID=520843 RepID=A0ABD1M4X9_9FABA
MLLLITNQLCKDLFSPTFFSLTLHHPYTLSLPQKTFIVACHLLSSLHLIVTSSPLPSTITQQRDLDATLLIFFLFQNHIHNSNAFDTPLYAPTTTTQRHSPMRC